MPAYPPNITPGEESGGTRGYGPTTHSLFTQALVRCTGSNPTQFLRSPGVGFVCSGGRWVVNGYTLR